MIIRNCLSLLKELSHLEEDIAQVETHLQKLDIQVDREKILRRLVEECVNKKE